MKNNRSAGTSLEDISPRISQCHAVDAGANDELVERHHETDRRNLVKDKKAEKKSGPDFSHVMLPMPWTSMNR
jgi:hypothetical protein